MIRDAELADVPALVELENLCFEVDVLSARSFRHFLTKGNADLFLDEVDGQLRGYCLILYHRNTSLARLYSIAVAPHFRKQGLAAALLSYAEERALNEGATRMRLEVNQKNRRAKKLYQDLGYEEFAVYLDYYEDHTNALRMEKELAPHLAPDPEHAPYYRQTLDFTCGPACLMMAMKAQDPDMQADRALEIQLWRESTTVFMTSGLGGCGALGLALAAHRRGFEVEVSVSDETEIFVGSVRSEEKKEIIRLVEQQFVRDTEAAGIRIRRQPFTATGLKERMDRGGVPIALISSYRLTGEKAPHWIKITDFDERFIYINDPYVDPDANRTETDCIGIPIIPQELDRMMKLGRKKHFATVIVYSLRKDAKR
jgi:ribosomal protein S18 acetylase RimI-like enzyme